MPRGDVVWGQEIDLDLQMASAICPLCKITLIAATVGAAPRHHAGGQACRQPQHERDQQQLRDG